MGWRADLAREEERRRALASLTWRERLRVEALRIALVLLGVALAAALAWRFAAAEEAALSGHAEVLDGDTLRVAGVAVRLVGIDAPELDQRCKAAGGREFNCGKSAAKFLTDFIRGKPVNCVIEGRDRYERSLGVCSDDRGIELNVLLVFTGTALAFVKYDDRYVDREADARQNKRGLWAGTFEKPWDWRAAKLIASEQPVEGNCVIKGNITRKGERIYHMPFHVFYSRTKIDESDGERMFCSESEARAAGWRRTLR